MVIVLIKLLLFIVEDIDESLLPIAYEKIKEINKNKREIESEEAKLKRILEDINMVYFIYLLIFYKQFKNNENERQMYIYIILYIYSENTPYDNYPVEAEGEEKDEDKGEVDNDNDSDDDLVQYISQNILYSTPPPLMSFHNSNNDSMMINRGNSNLNNTLLEVSRESQKNEIAIHKERMLFDYNMELMRRNERRKETEARLIVKRDIAAKSQHIFNKMQNDLREGLEEIRQKNMREEEKFRIEKDEKLIQKIKTTLYL